MCCSLTRISYCACRGASSLNSGSLLLLNDASFQEVYRKSRKGVVLLHNERAVDDDHTVDVHGAFDVQRLHSPSTLNHARNAKITQSVNCVKAER